MSILAGLLWKRIDHRPMWDTDGFLNWIALERHRLTGAYRTVHIDERFVNAREFALQSSDLEVSET